MNRALILLATLVVAAATVISPADAARPKPKPKAKAFTPKVGTYGGTAKAPDGTQIPVSGQVYKTGKTFYVRATVPAKVTCDDGVSFAGGVTLSAVVNGKSFTATASGTDSRFNGPATYKLSGSFRSAKALSGKASKTVQNGTVNPPVNCTSGDVTFSMKLK